LTHSFLERESEVDPEVERNLLCHKMLYNFIYYLSALKRAADLLIRSLCSAFITLFTKHLDSTKFTILCRINVAIIEVSVWLA